MDISEESLDRRLALATLERAQAFWETGNREQAMRDFQEAYSSAPDLASIHYSKAVYQIGVEKRETGDLEGALSDFKFAQEIALDGNWKVEIQQSIHALELRLHPPKPQPIMITECPKCGTPVQPDWLFCPNCTANLKAPITVEKNKCSQCGAESEIGWVVCPSCGKLLSSKQDNEKITESQYIERLLRDLLSEDDYIRKAAVEEFRLFDQSNERIVTALEKVASSDKNNIVASAARQTLDQPAHLEIIRQLGHNLEALEITKNIKTKLSFSTLNHAIQSYGNSGYSIVTMTDTSVTLTRRSPVVGALLIPLILLFWPAAIIYAIPGARKLYKVSLYIDSNGQIIESGGTLDEFERGKRRNQTIGTVLIVIFIILITLNLLFLRNQ